MMQRLTHQTVRRLLYFRQIAEAGSISGAAGRLNLSVAVVSAALSELETELDATLATRSTRHFGLTPEGERVKVIADTIAETASQLWPGETAETRLQGSLWITLPVELATCWLPPLLGGFGDRHPDVVLNVHASDAIEHLTPTPIELALRTGFAPVSPREGDPMALPLSLVAAPRFLGLPCERIPLIDNRERPEFAPVSRRTGMPEPTGFARILQVNNRLTAISMARHGLGAVLAIRASVENELAAGDLVELMPEHDHGSVKLRWVYRDRKPSALARAFAAFATAQG